MPKNGNKLDKMLGRELGTISRSWKVFCSSVQTNIGKCRLDGNVQSSKCPRDERVLIQNVQINPRTKAKENAADAGETVLTWTDLLFTNSIEK